MIEGLFSPQQRWLTAEVQEAPYGQKQMLIFTPPRVRARLCPQPVEYINSLRFGIANL